MTMSGHAADESVDGVLRHLLPDLDQAISERQSVVILNAVGCTDT